MRRVTSITLAVLLLLTIVTGFAEMHVHPGDSGLHVVVAVLFILSTLVHVVMNRKSFFRYFSSTYK